MVFMMMQFIHEQAYHVPTNKSILTDNWVIEVVTFVLIEGCFTLPPRYVLLRQSPSADIGHIGSSASAVLLHTTCLP